MGMGKNVKSGLGPKNPPHCGLNPSKCFCFYLTSLIFWKQYLFVSRYSGITLHFCFPFLCFPPLYMVLRLGTVHYIALWIENNLGTTVFSSETIFSTKCTVHNYVCIWAHKLDIWNANLNSDGSCYSLNGHIHGNMVEINSYFKIKLELPPKLELLKNVVPKLT